MDIRHLKSFIAIADHGTFGAAGDAIGLTQSAISHHIQLIEDYLKVKIFDRTARPPVLTTHGVTLLEDARRLVRDYERIKGNLAGDQISGNLLLGAVRSCVTGLLPKALVVLRERYPKLRVHVKTAASLDLIPMINTGHIDVAVIPGEKKLTEGICWLPFTAEPLKVIAPASAKGLTDKDLLESYPYIRFKKDSPVTRMIENEIRRRNINVTEEMQTDTFGVTHSVVSHGLGVAVAPEQAIENPFPENVRSVPFGDPPLTRVVGLIYRDTSTKTRIIETLHNELCRLNSSPKHNDR